MLSTPPGSPSPGADGLRGARDRMEAGAAEPVDRLARDLDRQAREQRRHPRDVPVVLASLVGAAENDVLDAVRREGRAPHQAGDRRSRQIIGAELGQRAAGPADRGAHRGGDEGLAHAGFSGQGRAWLNTARRRGQGPRARRVCKAAGSGISRLRPAARDRCPVVPSPAAGESDANRSLAPFPARAGARRRAVSLARHRGRRAGSPRVLDRPRGRPCPGRAGAPVAYAQVIVVGSALSALTDPGGAYLLPAVPAGPVTLRATRVGYRPTELGGTVRAGRTLTLNFTLADQRSAARQLAEEKDAAKAANVPRGAAMLRRDELQASGAVTDIVAAPAPEPWRWAQEPGNTEAYNTVDEHRFVAAVSNPLSTFSIDVDAASYSNVRRFLSQGQLPPATPCASRSWSTTSPTHYPDRPRASTRSPSSPRSAVRRGTRRTGWCASACRAAACRRRSCRRSNLVFLIDVSGSMKSREQAAAGEASLRLLVDELRPRTAWPSWSTPARRAWCCRPRPATEQAGHPATPSSAWRPAARPPAARASGSPTRWRAEQFHARRQQPRHPGHRRRLQRRRQQRRRAGAADRGEAPRRASSSPCWASAWATSRTRRWSSSPTTATATTPTSTT